MKHTILALALLLSVVATAAHAQEPAPPETTKEVMPAVQSSQGSDHQAGEVGDEPASPADLPLTVADLLRSRVAAIAWCPVLAGKEPAPATYEAGEPVAEGDSGEDKGCGAGMALRLTPDHWRRLAPGEQRAPTRWAGGLFVGTDKSFGPWLGHIALRMESGAVGFGVGWRVPYDDARGGYDLSDGGAVVGATVSLAGLGGGG